MYWRQHICIHCRKENREREREREREKEKDREKRKREIMIVRKRDERKNLRYR